MKCIIVVAGDIIWATESCGNKPLHNVREKNVNRYNVLPST